MMVDNNSEIVIIGILSKVVITSPTRGGGRLCFHPLQYVGRYIEQIPGASTTPIVTKQLYSWPQGTR